MRYVRPGELVGVVAALSGPSATWVQTVSDCRIWMLDPAAVKRIAHADLSIAWLVAEECARRVAALVNEISGSAFATVRQRTSRNWIWPTLPATCVRSPSLPRSTAAKHVLAGASARILLQSGALGLLSRSEHIRNWLVQALTRDPGARAADSSPWCRREPRLGAGTQPMGEGYQSSAEAAVRAAEHRCR